MCMPFKHKWKTIDSHTKRIYDEYSDGTDLPLRIYQIIRQQCEKCGKEVVRKFRI